MMHALWPPILFSVGVALLTVPLSHAYYSGLYCTVAGHSWNIEPPWSGKDIRHRPACQRCAHEPETVAVTGSHAGDHRV